MKFHSTCLIPLSLIILAGLTSFTHKDLNEYGKWLQFHKLKEDSFAQTGTEKPFSLEWVENGITENEKTRFEPYFFYSPDSSLFLDMDSYIGEPETKIQIVRTKSMSTGTLLFLGPGNWTETAIWRGNSLVEIFGFTQSDQERFVPTIWKYNLEKMTFTEHKSKKTFKEIPEKYRREVKVKKK